MKHLPLITAIAGVEMDQESITSIGRFWATKARFKSRNAGKARLKPDR